MLTTQDVRRTKVQEPKQCVDYLAVKRLFNFQSVTFSMHYNRSSSAKLISCSIKQHATKLSEFGIHCITSDLAGVRSE